MNENFVDGDGSPVKETVIEVAVEKALDVVIVTSVDRYSLKIIQKMSLLCMLIKERMLLILKLCS